MDFGITSKTKEYHANLYQKNKATGATDSTSFLSAISAKATEKTEGMSFEETLKSRYPGAYYNVMDTSRIDSGLWGRQDYPWNAYFKEPADDAVLDWKPTGAEPDMQSPEVHAKINSMLGKVAIVIPPELEEKMKNDPELAQKVMDRINNFILTNEASEPGTLKGYVMTFDENGEINHACVVGEGRITHSVTETGREKVDKLHEEYERIAEDNALKRKLLQEVIEEKHYKSSIAKEDVSAAYEANVLTESAGISGFDSAATGANV